MTDEEKLIAARAEDLYSLSQKYAEPRFSGFLNEREAAVAKENAGFKPGFETVFWGGYTDAERCMMGVFPEWETQKIFPITLIKIIKGYDRTLTHRDYLGSILSLGLERGKIGDILTDNSGAYVFVSDDISDYILLNIKKIANCGVKLERVPVDSVELPQHEFKIVSAVAASDRLDALLAAALGISRRESSLLIKSGKVSVNHKEAVGNSVSVKEGDVISARGYGRIILDKIGSTTGSGRIHVNFKKYK